MVHLEYLHKQHLIFQGAHAQSAYAAIVYVLLGLMKTCNLCGGLKIIAHKNFYSVHSFAFLYQLISLHQPGSEEQTVSYQTVEGRLY